MHAPAAHHDSLLAHCRRRAASVAAADASADENEDEEITHCCLELRVASTSVLTFSGAAVPRTSVRRCALGS